MKTHFLPLSPERWGDLEQLFSGPGDAGGCWCMFWRASRGQFSRLGKQGKRKAFRSIVDGGQVTGLLAYVDGEPAGWISVAPRETYPSLERSRRFKRIDDQPVWSIVCFFIDQGHRGQGLMGALIDAAVEYAAQCGAVALEAYPTDPEQDPRGPAAAYMGLLPSFIRAGFREVARPSAGRVIVRRDLAQTPS